MKPVLLLLMLAAIHACGFQLRGALQLSDDISPLYLKQNSAFELAREIKALLLSNNVKLAENIKQSKAQLTLIHEKKSRRILSVDANGRAREYLLSYEVRYSIQLPADGETVAGSKAVENTVSLSRSLLFDPNAVLAVTNESVILYKDMRRDAARQVLLKLQARLAQSVAESAAERAAQ